jgi:hypothetical protein
VDFDSAAADGAASSERSTKLTLTFDTVGSGVNMPALDVADITLAPAEGYSFSVTAGALTSLSAGVYELEVTGSWTEGGVVDVTVAKAGYAFDPDTRSATLHDFAATTLTVSNTVTSVTPGYANMSKEFTYTVTLKGMDGEPMAGAVLDYTGGGDKEDGSLTLDASGSAVFTLKHGESITIGGVPSAGRMRIVQTGEPGYTPSYRDNMRNPELPPEIGTTGNDLDTGERYMTAEARVMDFANERAEIVPSAVDAGDLNVLLILIGAALLSILALYAVRRYRRRAWREAE